MNGFGCPSDCPRGLSGLPPAYGDIVGQVRRLAPADPPPEVDETKRNVLKLLAVAGLVGAAGGGLVAGSLQYAQPPQIGLTSFPRVQLLDLDGAPLTVAKVEREYNVETRDVLTFAYPLRNEPNFLINLAPASPGGVGASNALNGIGHTKSIVAFSAICQHLGCPSPAISFFPPGVCPQTPGGRPFYIHCTCHGSTYDAANGASNLTGPAVLPLPQVILEWDQSDDSIYAVNEVGPPVNGHLSTLQGDYAVGSQSPLSKQQPVTLCNFPQ
ncbi:MAG TPA: Rieske 2Fe-2S domain-containing protein [Thermoplasmata archaeon]|nr:Rieske 2Fe-2S domain-containing protein [Thermoplasmata archaeon]HEV2429151.1 Rieske 2Fe-2S domain-containing protein [Thermoplasmata archaeon]